MATDNSRILDNIIALREDMASVKTELTYIRAKVETLESFRTKITVWALATGVFGGSAAAVAEKFFL